MADDGLRKTVSAMLFREEADCVILQSAGRHAISRSGAQQKAPRSPRKGRREYWSVPPLRIELRSTL